MWITKNNGDDAFRRRVDAVSRVTIWAMNHANSPQIAKLGLSHLPGIAIDVSGTNVLHGGGPGLTMEINYAAAAEPDFRGGLPALTTPTMPMTPSSFQRVFFDVTSSNSPSLFQEMAGGYDPLYTAKKLGLLKRNMDQGSGPKLVRAFCDSRIPADGINDMVCCDANGDFAGRYILLNGTVFEAKYFKYVDSPAGGYFLFTPNESAIYAPFCCSGVFTANANIASHNLRVGWICTAGGAEKLGREVLARFENGAQIVWAEFPDDLLLTKDNFAETFAIATEAKRRGVAMKIIRATATACRSDGWWDAQERVLDDREIKKVARRFKLKIDQVWCGLPGEIDFDNESRVRKVPPFWDGNRISEFFGKKSDDFLLEVLTQRLTPWVDCGRVLVIVDEKDLGLARQIHAAGGDQVRIFTSNLLSDRAFFAEKVPDVADMVFIITPADEKSDLPKTCEVCAQARLPVGIFSRNEDASLREADVVHYCVKKLSSSTADVFCVKNMGSDAITEYTFSPIGVAETPGSEENMRKGE